MKRLAMLPAAVLAAALLLAACSAPGRPPGPVPGPLPPPPAGRGAEPPAAGAVRTVPVALRVAPGVPPLAAVRFPGPETGWAAGRGVILATDDGGRTWTSQYEGSAHLTALAFPDARHGWAAGPDVLLHTANGGRAWAPVPLPEAIGPVRAVRYASEQIACVQGVNGRLYATANAWQQWREAAAPGGVVACAARAAGRDWAAAPPPAVQPPPRPPAAWTLLDLPGAAGAWALLDSGALLATGDAGRTWTQHGWPARDEPLRSLSFFSATHGWALTMGGRLLHTTDGGATWGQLNP